MIQTIRDAESKIWTLQKEVTYFKTKINELENQINSLSTEVEDVKRISVAGVSINGTNGDSIINSDGTTISHRLFHIFEKLKAKEFETDKITTKDLTVTNSATIKDLSVSGNANFVNINASNDITAGHNITATNKVTTADFQSTGNSANNNITANTVTSGSENVNNLTVNTQASMKHADIFGNPNVSQFHVTDGNNDQGFYIICLANSNVLFSVGSKFSGGNWIATNTAAVILSMNAGGAGAFVFFANTGLTPGVAYGPTIKSTIPF